MKQNFCSFLLIALVASVSFSAAARKKIYVFDDYNTAWPQSALYAWQADKDLGHAWPGVTSSEKVTLCGLGYQVFYAPVAWNYQTINLIYNNGVTDDTDATRQTDNYSLTLTDDCYFRVTAATGSDPKINCALVRQYRMDVHDLTGWDDMYVYAWADGQPELFGAWPGTRLEKNGDSYLLMFDEFRGADYHIIFNNGRGDDDGKQQLETDNAGNGFMLPGNADKAFIVGSRRTDTPDSGYIVFMAGEDGEYGLDGVRAGLWKDGALRATVDMSLWEEIDEGYFYRAYIEDFPAYDGVEFYLSFTDGVEKKIVTNSAAAQGNVDADWHRYIYGPAESRGQNSHMEAVPSYQSYYTPEQFLADYKAPHTAVYGCGNMRGTADWNLSNCVRIDLEDGLGVAQVVTGDINTLSSDPPRFKLSWIDAPGRMNKEGVAHNMADTGNNMRAWATFNLGIMGGYYPVRENLPDYMTSRSFFYLRRPVHYYGTSTADWTPFVDSEGNRNVQPNTTYYIVIDTHPEFESVTLLTFDPTPEITSLSLSEPSQIQVSDDYGTTAASMLRGSAYSGEARISTANTVSAVADVLAADTHASEEARNELAKEFDVYYDFYHTLTSAAGGEQGRYLNIGRLKGNPHKVRIPYVVFGKDVDLLTRGVYYAKYDENDPTLLPQHAPGFRTFASKRSCEGTLDIPAPRLNETPLMLKAVEGGHGDIRTGLHLEAAYTPDNPAALHYYPDYTMVAAGRDEAIVAHSGLWYMGKPYIGATPVSGYEPYTGGAYDHTVHNWSDKSRDESILRLYLDLGAEGTEAPGQVTLTATMVYPFVIFPDNTIEKVGEEETAQHAPARAAATWQEGMELYPVSVSDTRTYDVSGGVLSGAADISAGSPDISGPVYYNLQGMRLSSRPRTGVCIVVGSDGKVTKERMM